MDLLEFLSVDLATFENTQPPIIRTPIVEFTPTTKKRIRRRKIPSGSGPQIDIETEILQKSELTPDGLENDSTQTEKEDPVSEENLRGDSAALEEKSMEMLNGTALELLSTVFQVPDGDGE
jgi:hypothetical protein